MWKFLLHLFPKPAFGWLVPLRWLVDQLNFSSNKCQKLSENPAIAVKEYVCEKAGLFFLMKFSNKCFAFTFEIKQGENFMYNINSWKIILFGPHKMGWWIWYISLFKLKLFYFWLVLFITGFWGSKHFNIEILRTNFTLLFQRVIFH